MLMYPSTIFQSTHTKHQEKKNEKKLMKNNIEEGFVQLLFIFFKIFFIDTAQLSLNNKRSSIFRQQQEEENASYKIQNAYEQ